jgi:hypothetical protein
MFRMILESILAHVIAFEEAGVPLKELKQAVGRDGETIIGGGRLTEQSHLNRCESSAE